MKRPTNLSDCQLGGSKIPKACWIYLRLICQPIVGKSPHATGLVPSEDGPETDAGIEMKAERDRGGKMSDNS